MTKRNRPAVEVYIPAFNEAVNIGDLLNSLVSQQQNYYKLQKICVYSDCSTDETVSIAKKMSRKYSLIKVEDFPERRGKLYRLNQIFNNFHADFLVILDGDIQVIGLDFLDNLIKELIKDNNAQMVVAHEIPLEPKNIIGKLIYSSFLMWDFIRTSIPECDHVQNFYGAATAYRKSFAGKLHIPALSPEERLYIYLSAKKVAGFRYSYAAQIRYWPPSTLSDFYKMSYRTFGKDQPELDRLFNLKTDEVCRVPLKYKLKGILRSFAVQPFTTVIAIAFNWIFSLLSAHQQINQTASWEITGSTKKSFI